MQIKCIPGERCSVESARWEPHFCKRAGVNTARTDGGADGDDGGTTSSEAHGGTVTIG